MVNITPNVTLEKKFWKKVGFWVSKVFRYKPIIENIPAHPIRELHGLRKPFDSLCLILFVDDWAEQDCMYTIYIFCYELTHKLQESLSLVEIPSWLRQISKIYKMRMCYK